MTEACHGGEIKVNFDRSEFLNALMCLSKHMGVFAFHTRGNAAAVVYTGVELRTSA